MKRKETTKVESQSWLNVKIAIDKLNKKLEDFKDEGGLEDVLKDMSRRLNLFIIVDKKAIYFNNKLNMWMAVGDIANRTLKSENTLNKLLESIEHDISVEQSKYHT